MKEKKLVYGVGFNDADYAVTRYTEISGKRTRTWICPFYRKWTGMLCRCYSQSCHSRQPTYVGCSVAEEWHYFMTFRAWMETQDWEGKVLDKDILFPGNKIYGPETCIFIETRVNSFVTDSKATRGEYPIGVSLEKGSGKYRALCWSVSAGKQIKLGYFSSAEEAHQTWLTFKLEQAKILASEQSDERVSKALITRYENYSTL